MKRFSIFAATAIAACSLVGCATPVQTVAPKAVAPAAGNIQTVVYTQADLLPHSPDEGAMLVLSPIKELGGLFHEKGYTVANRSSNWPNTAIVDFDWVLLDTPQSTTHLIPYSLQDKYSNIEVPPATSTEVLAQLGDLYKAGGGSGVLDADGSTYSNGAAITGSLGGGLVVGLAVGAAQTVAHAVAGHVEKPKERPRTVKKLPLNTAILFGRIRQTVGTIIRPPQEQRVIIVASSDKPELPAVLLDAALRKYVDVYEKGAKANPTSMDEPQAVSAVKGEIQK